GTGHAGESDGVVGRTALAFALEPSSRVDSATSARRTSARIPAYTLLQASGLRLFGSRRRATARLSERLKRRSIWARSPATDRDYPRRRDQKLRRLPATS